MKFSRSLLLGLLLTLAAGAALAGNTIFYTSVGDVVLPISSGGMDNIPVGQTTPAAVKATTLQATGAVALSPASANVVLAPTGSGTVTVNPTAAGTLDNVALGGTTAAPVTASTLKLDTGTKTATASSGAATLSKSAGVITTEALTTAAGATYTLTITDTAVAAADQVFASVQNGSSTTGTPCVTTVTPGAGTLVIVVQNIHASAAVNGTLKIAFGRLVN